mgnify:CR=1 FL=1
MSELMKQIILLLDGKIHMLHQDMYASALAGKPEATQAAIKIQMLTELSGEIHRIHKRLKDA